MQISEACKIVYSPDGNIEFHNKCYGKPLTFMIKNLDFQRFVVSSETCPIENYDIGNALKTTSETLL